MKRKHREKERRGKRLRVKLDDPPEVLQRQKGHSHFISSSSGSWLAKIDEDDAFGEACPLRSAMDTRIVWPIPFPHALLTIAGG